MKTIVLLVTLLASAAQAQMMHEDIVYAEVSERALKLDLYLPAQQTGPLIVYVHGGAWRSGSKRDVPLLGLVKSGYAIASVDYSRPKPLSRRTSTTSKPPSVFCGPNKWTIAWTPSAW